MAIDSAVPMKTGIHDAEDAFLCTIGRLLEQGEIGASIVNPQRLREMQFTYRVVRDLLAGGDMRVSYRLHEPLKSMGSISVEGKRLAFSQPEWFARAAEFADSTEIYPLVNDEVRITFTFHNLTTSV